VHADPPDESSWIVAVDEQELESVNHDSDELDLKIAIFLVNQLSTHVIRILTIWSPVRYFFHHKYFWYCGPIAANK
jgi:hypothetical protein